MGKKLSFVSRLSLFQVVGISLSAAVVFERFTGAIGNVSLATSCAASFEMSPERRARAVQDDGVDARVDVRHYEADDFERVPVDVVLVL